MREWTARYAAASSSVLCGCIACTLIADPLHTFLPGTATRDPHRTDYQRDGHENERREQKKREEMREKKEKEQIEKVDQRRDTLECGVPPAPKRYGCVADC